MQYHRLVLAAAGMTALVSCAVTRSGDSASESISKADPYQETASWLCSKYRAPSSLSDDERAARFDASLTFPTAALRHYFASTVQKHGECVNAKLQSFASEGEAGPGQTFFLSMGDGKRVVVSFALSPAGKITAPNLGADGEDGVGIIGPESDYDVDVQSVPAADGAKLRTIVFRRPGAGVRRPSIVLRTPYFRLYGRFQYAHYFATADYYLDEGYDFVLQAIRGTGGSEGDYHFMNPQEVDDGEATVRWVGSQSFSDGNVGVVGVSYDGFTALAAAVKNPPGLKVVMAGGSPTQAASGPFMRNGLVDTKQLDYLRYNTTQSGPVFLKSDDPNRLNELLLGHTGESDVRRYDELAFGVVLPEWKTLASHIPNAADPFWKTRQIFDRIHAIDVPTYHIAGMHKDGDMLDVLANFDEISAHAAHPERHRLILGDWDHGNSIPYDNGANAGPFVRERYRALLAHHLKGAPTPFTAEPRVQVASHEGPAFLGSDVFPPPSLAPTTLYFHSDGSKRILEEARTDGAADSSYEYDPLTPIDFTHPNPKHLVAFDFHPGRRTPILGYLDFDLHLKIAGVDGAKVEQMDVILLVIKKHPGNTNLDIVSDCMMGGKVTNDADVVRLQTRACFVKTLLEAEDSLEVAVVSNGYPLLFRNTGGPVTDYFSDFRRASVALLHSADHPSKLTFTEEPN